MSSTPTLALCTVLRDERRYILEWVAYHQLLGVSRFLIFDNESVDGSQTLLAELKRLGVAMVVPLAGRGGAMQLAAFQESSKALAGKCDFIGFLDVDEFLVADSGLPSWLSAAPADVGAIAVCQMVFGSNRQTHYEPDLVISRFTRRAEAERGEHRWVKTIARPECVEGFSSSHNVTLRSGRYVMADFAPFQPAAHPGEAARICHAPIHFNHYILKSRQEFAWKQKRGALSDTGDYTRFTDGYFAGRDPGSNAVEDLRAAAQADAVRDRIRALLAGFSDEARAMVVADLRL